MLNLDELKKAKQKLAVRDEKRQDIHLSSYKEALICLENFSKDPEKRIKHLKEAAKKITESISVKSNEAEPYVCLSYIFYVLGEIKISIKYLQIAREFEPNSQLVEQLRRLISNLPLEENKNFETVSLNNDKKINISEKSESKKNFPELEKVKAKVNSNSAFFHFFRK